MSTFRENWWLRRSEIESEKSGDANHHIVSFAFIRSSQLRRLYAERPSSSRRSRMLVHSQRVFGSIAAVAASNAESARAKSPAASKAKPVSWAHHTRFAVHRRAMASAPETSP